MENMHVLAMLLPVVNNQKVNEINTRIKTGPQYEPFLLYLTKKRHVQTQVSQHKTWQHMTRRAQTSIDEDRQSGAYTRCPLVLKTTVRISTNLYFPKNEAKHYK